MDDWSGLEIGVGGDRNRMYVWRLVGQIRISGVGDFENVRGQRDQVLREFPAETPAEGNLPSGVASDDDVKLVIGAALDEQGGFIGQADGAEIVRARFPSVTRDRARALTKEMTGNNKPGPKGPRRK